MSFSVQSSNYIPQATTPSLEQQFLEGQSQFISSAERVQIWINTFSRTSEAPISAKRHLQIMQATFTEIERMYAHLSGHFLSGRAYSFLQKRLEDISGIIKPSPKQDILDYLKQTLNQKRNDYTRCELSIQYNEIPIDFQRLDGLVQEYHTSEHKELVISKMQFLLETIRSKLLVLEKARVSNLHDFQEAFRQKEQIAKRVGLETQLNKFETLQKNYVQKPHKTLEHMKSCMAEIHKMSASLPHSADLKQRVKRYERFLIPREFRVHMEKIDALKKCYLNESQKRWLVSEMRRHVEAIRQLPTIDPKHIQQLEQLERQLEQYEAKITQCESIERQMQMGFAKFNDSKEMFEGSAYQKEMAASEMRHCISELYFHLEELEQVHGPEEKRFQALVSQVYERDEETIFCELTLHIDKCVSLSEKEEWYKKFWFYVNELIEIPNSQLRSRVLEKYRRLIEMFILKKRNEVCLPTDKGLDGIQVMAKLLTKCPIPARGEGEYKKILDRLRLNFGEAIVFMQSLPVPPAFVALAYREIGKRSNPIITAHTIRWALIELKKFRGDEKKWSEIGAIRQKKYFKNEIEKLRQQRKDNEELSDTSEEETKERGEFQFDTMAHPKMRKLERDLEKRLEKESEINPSPHSSLPQTPILLEARETLRNEDITGHFAYDALCDATIRAAATLSINITREQLENNLTIDLKQKRYKFGKFLVDVKNGKGKVNNIRSLVRKRFGCAPYNVTEQDRKVQEEGEKELLKAMSHVLNVRIVYQNDSYDLMTIGSHEKKTIRLRCEKEERDDNPKPKKLRRVEPASPQYQPHDNESHEITDPQERINQLLQPLLEDLSKLSYTIDMPALLDKLRPLKSNVTDMLFLLKQLKDKYERAETSKQRSDICDIQNVLRDSIRNYEQKKLTSMAKEKGRNTYVLYRGSCEENDSIFLSPRLQDIPSDGVHFYNALLQEWQEIIHKQDYLDRINCGTWGAYNCFFAAIQPHQPVLQKCAQALHISETSDGKDFRKALFQWMRNHLAVVLNPGTHLYNSITVQSLIEEMRAHPHVSQELKELSIEDYLEEMGNSDEYIGEELYSVISHLTEVAIITCLPQADECDATNNSRGSGSGRILKLQGAGILASSLNFPQKIYVFSDQGHNEALIVR